MSADADAAEPTSTDGGDRQQTKARAVWRLLTEFSNRFANDDDYEAHALIVQQATEASERVIKHALSVRAGGDDARGSRGVVDERLASSFVDSPRLRHPPVERHRRRGRGLARPARRRAGPPRSRVGAYCTFRWRSRRTKTPSRRMHGRRRMPRVLRGRGIVRGRRATGGGGGGNDATLG